MNPVIVFRQIKKHKDVFWVNLTGLTLAFVTVFVVFAYVWHEFHYDRFHKNRDRIVRVTENSNTGESSMIDARVSGTLAPLLKTQFPEIEAYNRLMSWRKATVTIDDNSFYCKNVYSVDSGFFGFFSFKLLQGDKRTIFNSPGQLAISEKMAKTYFGTTNVIGKQVHILYQTDYKAADFIIKGVFRDFPDNSHFKADFLCSQPDIGRPPNWTYSYLLLAPHCDYKLLNRKIQHYMDSTVDDNRVKAVYNLQPLTDIHFYSHKSRELQRNANIKSILLLISGAFIILIIALINFANLNYIRYIGNEKNHRIRKIIGASTMSLSIDFLYDILVLLVVVIFTGFTIIHYISALYGFPVFNYAPQYMVILFTILFALLIIIIAFIPSLFWRQKQISKTNSSRKNTYKVSLVTQLTLSLMALTGSLIIQKQISFINRLHPQAKNTHMILIPENTGMAVYNYQSFKERLLKHPEILSVTACSEPPAGVVTDNFKYSFDHHQPSADKTLNTMIIDTNFFSFLNIKPLAGSADISDAGSLTWERKALKLLKYRYMKKEIPAKLEKEVAHYSDKYIINKTALHLLGLQNPQDAVGKSFYLIHPMPELFPEGKIVGVVDDFHYTNLFVTEKPLVMVCKHIFFLNFMVKFVPKKSKEALSIIKTEWKNSYPDIPLNFEFVNDAYQKVYQREYNEMEVLSLFSLISILLSLIGAFAMLSFNLKKRTKEIGIRKVNGAGVFDIINLFNASLFKTFAPAFVIAVPVSWYAMRIWLQNFAYQTEVSPWLFFEAGIIMLVIIFTTVSVQTYIVARKNPVESLRYE